jgi:hypothetical protein
LLTPRRFISALIDITKPLPLMLFHLSRFSAPPCRCCLISHPTTPDYATLTASAAA